MLKKREGLRSTKWMNMEAVGKQSRGFLNFALEESQKSKTWAWKRLQEVPFEKGAAPEWQAAQLRRRYLVGKPLLHTVPGVIFESAMLEAVYQAEGTEEERQEGWNSLFLPLRGGWTGQRSTRGAVTQQFSFDGQTKTVVAAPSETRLVTPEKAESDLFDHQELVWKWGTIHIGGNVEAAVQTAFKHWHIPWRGREGFFGWVKGIEVRKVHHQDVGVADTWQLRIIFN